MGPDEFGFFVDQTDRLVAVDWLADQGHWALHDILTGGVTLCQEYPRLERAIEMAFTMAFSKFQYIWAQQFVGRVCHAWVDEHRPEKVSAWANRLIEEVCPSHGERLGV